VTARTIRPARAGDLDRLLEIEAEAFEGDRFERRTFRHAMRSPTMVLLVAEHDGEVAGYAAAEFRRNSRIARLTSIAVGARTARKGLGRRLLRALEAAVAAAGCDRLRLEVRGDNAAARTLYEGDGYAVLGRIPDYYEDGAAAARYEKRLAAASA
jgi:ribosomal-protein-alanine N-acetyltransferase